MEAMRRCQPKTIFTDEGQPVGDAVKMVMPEAKHQLGLWYVRRNASKYLPTYYVQPRFESLFNKCISDCHTEEEFESTWSSLLEQFDLHKNHWLNTLYKSRVRWAYIFNKESFCAGIRCSDNIKSIFQNLMGETITLQMFVQQYFKAAEQQRREELYEDFHCNESVPEMTLDYGLVEKHAAGIYTHTVFTAFQKELHKVLSVALREISSNGPVSIFQLTEVGLKKSTVEYNCVNSSIVCSCKKYESVGVLCAHTLKVLNARNVIHIPPQYILKRWTKSAKDGVVADLYGQEMADKRQQAVHLLMRKALNVITKGVSVNESQNIVDNCLDMALKRVEDGLGRRFDVNWMSAEGAEKGAVLSSPNGALSSFQMDFGIRSSGGGRCNKRDMEAIEAERASSRASDDEETD
ncbi:hypothetical protein GH714_031478 [Hevea brasiliensis]|uniref:Protein FAR1-RELATED SEQUENCE n=1 Tax=Hevea brasiliensis TaxID=3981 RepID=A0A6A6M5X8_HEVBR|nr:hypothetical protein GH714_031478 [Hevea brasiliensis]